MFSSASGEARAYWLKTTLFLFLIIPPVIPLGSPQLHLIAVWTYACYKFAPYLTIFTISDNKSRNVIIWFYKRVLLQVLFLYFNSNNLESNDVKAIVDICNKDLLDRTLNIKNSIEYRLADLFISEWKNLYRLVYYRMYFKYFFIVFIDRLQYIKAALMDRGCDCV